MKHNAGTSEKPLRKHRALSIKWKIFISLLVFCTLLLSLLWLFQVVFLDEFYRYIKINTIKSSAAAISDNIASDDLSDIVTAISSSNEICIDVYAADGTLLCFSHVLNDCIIHDALAMTTAQKRALYNETALSGNSTLLKYYTRDNSFPDLPRDDKHAKERFDGLIPPRGKQSTTESIIYSVIVPTDESDVLVIFNSVISPVDATVQTIRVQLCFVTGFMILFSIILAFFIARRVSKPIESINSSAKVLAKGNYNVHFNSGGYREIAELSETLNHAAHELSKVDGLRRELVANVSHDLRTPLTLITGYSEAVRDFPGEDAQESIQIIIDESKRLTSLVNDMLDLSKLQSGMQTLNISTFNLTEVVRDTISRLNSFCAHDGYSICFKYDCDVTVNADRTRISQVLYNLITNAINYSGERKEVVVCQTLCTLNEAASVKIEVTDFGEGISPDELPYIWDRYYKSKKNHLRAVTGSGIGLSIVKSVIDMHGGECGVISAPNSGSTFWFSLKL